MFSQSILCYSWLSILLYSYLCCQQTQLQEPWCFQTYWVGVHFQYSDLYFWHFALGCRALLFSHLGLWDEWLRHPEPLLLLCILLQIPIWVVSAQAFWFRPFWAKVAGKHRTQETIQHSYFPFIAPEIYKLPKVREVLRYSFPLLPSHLSSALLLCPWFIPWWESPFHPLSLARTFPC